MWTSLLLIGEIKNWKIREWRDFGGFHSPEMSEKKKAKIAKFPYFVLSV
jgi:hypothetical protein